MEEEYVQTAKAYRKALAAEMTARANEGEARTQLMLAERLTQEARADFLKAQEQWLAAL